jgi:hypothetical protein
MSIGQGSGITQRTSGTTGAVVYKGTLDASGGVYPSSPSNGDYYIVSVAGTISGTYYSVGDWAIYNGASWERLESGDDIFHTDIAAEISALTDKATPVDADVVLGENSAASPTAFTKIKITWAHIKATLKTYFDGIYQAIGNYIGAADDGLSAPAKAGNNGKVLGLVAGALQWVSAGGGKLTIANKSSNYPIVVGDTGKVLVDTAGITFTLPVIAAGDVGTEVILVKNNAGTTMVQANTGQHIADSNSAGTIYDSQASETYAALVLVAISTTQWIIVGMDGTWTTT